MDNTLYDKEISDTIWYKDINILFKKDLLSEFFPKINMTLNEKFNSVIRLFIYVSLALTFYKKNTNYLYILIFSMFLTYLIHSNYLHNTSEKFVNNLENKNEYEYVKPSFDNPFMNVSYDDYVKKPDRESISKKYLGNNEVTERINTDIEDKFNYNLYKDMSDIYDKNNSQRQFYTNPITTIPNDQTSFANWLYNTGPTCKEKNYSKCEMLNYNNLKQSSLYR